MFVVHTHFADTKINNNKENMSNKIQQQSSDFKVKCSEKTNEKKLQNKETNFQDHSE